MAELNKQALAKILESEGGYNPNEPDSVGGASYAGITRKYYNDWRKTKCTIIDAPSTIEGLAGKVFDTDKFKNQNPMALATQYPDLEIRLDVIIAFYTDYFEKHHPELLPECLQFMHLDFATNAGYASNKIIQKMLGCTGKDVDGILGSGSRTKMMEFAEDFNEEIKVDPYADNDLIKEYDEYKREHYNHLAEANPELHGKNLKGWLMRCDKVLTELAEYFDDPEPTPSAVLEEEENPFESVVVNENISLQSNTKLDQRVDILESDIDLIKNTVTSIKQTLEQVLLGIKNN